ncbi:MAG TPA: hypothetical protein VFB77_15730 [Acidimicrobiales bacterium]|nr:hypothetical protein [Acidimicrobiales bacterium]
MSTDGPYPDQRTGSSPRPPAPDEGGDPACWAHLFDDDPDPDAPDDPTGPPGGGESRTSDPGHPDGAGR